MILDAIGIALAVAVVCVLVYVFFGDSLRARARTVKP